MGNGNSSCPDGQHWDPNVGEVVGPQGSGSTPGGCVDNPPPPNQVPNSAVVGTSAAGTVFDSSAQNAQRPQWQQLSPLHL